MPDIEFVRREIERYRFQIARQSQPVLRKGRVPGGRRW